MDDKEGTKGQEGGGKTGTTGGGNEGQGQGQGQTGQIGGTGTAQDPKAKK